MRHVRSLHRRQFPYAMLLFLALTCFLLITAHIALNAAPPKLMFPRHSQFVQPASRAASAGSLFVRGSLHTALAGPDAPSTASPVAAPLPTARPAARPAGRTKPPGGDGKKPLTLGTPLDPRRTRPSQFSLEKSCAEYDAPHSQKQVCCYGLRNATALSCLPNLVILGSQKAGTTALHSYLMLHPQIRSPQRKELHTFDIDSNYNQMRLGHLSFLGQFDPSTVPSQVTIDSTPSYSASRMACQRLAKHLPPSARFVLILRNPTSRVWSELLMKRRRVWSQDLFKRALPGHVDAVRLCADAHANNLLKFTACLPRELAQHSKAQLLFKHLQGVGGGIMGGAMPSKLLEDVRAKQSSREARTRTRPCLVSPEALENCTVSRAAMSGMFLEKERSDAYILSEARNLTAQVCAYDTCAYFRNATALDPAVCAGCGCKCFPQARMISDISQNYVFRSLYKAHLTHCLQHLPQSRILFLDHAEILKDLPGTMLKVLAHAGVDAMDYSRVTELQASAKFDALYPGFKNMTGWGWETSNMPHNMTMSPELKRELDAFFHPDTLFLRQLTGLKLEGWP
jgi:hypothetical protein